MRRAWARGAAWLAAGVGVVAVVVGGGASPAWAHAELLETQPAAGEQLDTAPEQVILRYSEAVDPFDDAIEVFGSDGHQIETTDPAHLDGKPQLVSVDLPALEDGAYVVTWRVASEDSHPIRGAYTFRVGAGGDTAAAEALKDELVSAEGGDKTVGFLFGVVRFVGFVGLVLLVGGALFLAALWPAGLVDRRARRLLTGGWVAALIATVLSFGFQAAYSEGTGLGGIVDSGPVGDVFGTRPGRVWLIRLALLAVVAVVGAVAAKRAAASSAGAAGAAAERAAPGVIAGVVVVGLALMATISFAGHAGAGELVALAIVTDLVHLGSVAFWLGGLALLFVAVLRSPTVTAAPAPSSVGAASATGVLTSESDADSDVDGPVTTGSLASVVDRFSTLAFAAVVAIVASGSVQAWRQLRSFDALFDSTYGRVLIVKVALFAAMLAAAAVSRTWVRNRHSATTAATAATAEPVADGSADVDAAVDPAAEVDAPAPAAAPPLRTLRLSVGIEAGIAALVLAVTALLVNTVPGKDSVSPLYTTELHGSAVMVQVEVEPAVAGVVDVRITTLSHSGEPIAPPGVEASLSLPERDVPPIPLVLETTGTGAYQALDADVPFPGTWHLAVDVRVSEFDQDALTAEIPFK